MIFRHRRRTILSALLLLLIAIGLWQTNKPLPPGTTVDSGDIAIAEQDLAFLHDLTFRDSAGTTVHEQQVFDAVFRIVDQAGTTLVLDFFLFNDQAGNAGNSYRRLSRELADHLLAARRARPGLRILVLTDPINDVYGGAPSPLLNELSEGGIEVVRTNLVRLRDSNPGYSAPWRLFVQWWGNSPAISWLPNPFAEGPSKISLRSWLSLLNFKANHRKLIVADRADGTWTGLVASANPHDASSRHSNVAMQFSGPLASWLLASELDIARFSGWSGEIPAIPHSPMNDAASRIAFVTEESIRTRLLAAINESSREDGIAIAMFYLSDRRIVTALIKAAQRGARVRLILDPNKDAFGIEKDGVPNRPVARELIEASSGAISVRWYQTHGEQFHTKLVLVASKDRVIASLGSANLTRRNLSNYNLEANVQLDLPRTSAVAEELLTYFERLWSNPDGNQFTVAYAEYRDDSRLRYWRYRVMEATGLSTF